MVPEHMLSEFHHFVRNGEWYKVEPYISRFKYALNQKGPDGLSAKEIACKIINESKNIDFGWGTRELTALEYELNTIANLSIEGSADTIKVLVALGANVNCRNKNDTNSVLFYLQQVESLSCEKDRKFPAYKVIQALIKEGADFKPNTQGVNALDFAKEKFGEPISDYMKKLVPQSTVMRRIIKIQRAWRAHQYRKKNQAAFNKSSYGPVEPTFPLHLRLSLKPPIPIVDNSIDRSKANEWVKLHEPEDQALAEKVIQKIDYISFPKFEFALRMSIEKWNTFLMSRPKEGRKYVLLLGDHREEKSIPWVSSLALPYLAHPPNQILTWDKLGDIQKDTGHLLIIDDAAYSGNQITHFLTGLSRCRTEPKNHNFINAEVSLIIPFVSEKALPRIREDDVNLFMHRIIPIFKVEGLCFSGLTATYFAHKIAEKDISTINLLHTGETIRSQPGIQFIPQTLEPYKNSKEKYMHTSFTRKCN